MSQLKHEEGRFYIPGESKALAEITYKTDASTGTLTIDHTFVSEDLRGQGAGEQLVKAVVDKARQDNVKIVPLCPYAAHQFEKHKDYADVLSGN